jgi:hypothetical protein
MGLDQAQLCCLSRHQVLENDWTEQSMACLRYKNTLVPKEDKRFSNGGIDFAGRRPGWSQSTRVSAPRA